MAGMKVEQAGERERTRSWGFSVFTVGQRLAQLDGINSTIVVDVKSIKHLLPLLVAMSDEQRVRFGALTVIKRQSGSNRTWVAELAV